MAQTKAGVSSTSLFNHSRRFLGAVSAACIGIGWVFALLVWGNPMGLGATLFFSSLVLFMVYLSRQVFYRKNKSELTELGWATTTWRKSYQSVYYFPLLLAAWQIVVSCAFLYRIEVYTYIFLWIFYLITIPMLAAFLFFPIYPRAATIFNGVIFSLKYLIFSIVEGIKFIWEAPQNIFPFFRRRVLRMVLLGLFVGLVLLLFFGSLLSAADPVFKSYFDRIWEELINLIKYLELFENGRIVIMVFAPLVIAGGLFAISRYKLSNLYEVKKEKLVQWMERKQITSKRLSEFAFNAIVLGVVNLVFWGFVAIQLRYFFFGSDLTNILGKYTYAEYAQRGFVEMLVAVIFAYPLLAWFANRSDFNNKVVGWLASLANVSLVGALLIVLLSAIQRITLYQSTYGYSLRRLFVILGVIVVASVLFGHVGIMIYKKLAKVKRQFRFIALNEHFLMAFVGLAMLFTLTVMVPWPIFVTQANLNRYKETGKLDLVYLYTAPEETIPTLSKFVKQVENKEFTSKGVTPAQTMQTATLLKANLTERVIDINKQVVRRENSEGRVDGSVLAKIGGLNGFRWYNAHTVYDQLVDPLKKDKAQQALGLILSDFLSDYGRALTSQNYEQARTFWDPTFKPVNISQLQNAYRITGYSAEEISPADVANLVTDGVVTSLPVKVTMVQTSLTPNMLYNSREFMDHVTIAVQNGQLVIKSANRLPLAYQDYVCDSVYDTCNRYFDNHSNRMEVLTPSRYFNDDNNGRIKIPNPSP